ncbi:MAG TPA: V-type ATP synthase subunit K [Spirochaetia bacterium]|nr:V-type ATP synthase subunit K [Spirochaetales bacterium]HRY80159.1 V-type ATP synthase subunit K [Spirochaetia bacterium]
MNIGMIGAGAVMALSAIGSGIGAGIAGQAAIGAWKRNYLANKPASFLLMIFAGAPLTQTIYGFILMGAMMNSSKDPALLLAMGLAGGAGMAMSAVAQGKASAASCDAFGETGKGFANYITIVGLCETVALFVMAFSFGAL